MYCVLRCLSVSIQLRLWLYSWDSVYFGRIRNPACQLFTGPLHPRWCRISSINNSVPACVHRLCRLKRSGPCRGWHQMTPYAHSIRARTAALAWAFWHGRVGVGIGQNKWSQPGQDLEVYLQIEVLWVGSVKWELTFGQNDTRSKVQQKGRCKNDVTWSYRFVIMKIFLGIHCICYSC